MELNAYELLEVSHRAPEADIRKAYYRKAQLHHPDHGGKAEDFLMIRKAFDFLMNPKLRGCMGQIRMFKRLKIRIQPSLNSSLDQLIQNLEIVGSKVSNL